VNSKETAGIPAGYLVAEITACQHGVVTLWQSPDGKAQVWTFEGPIRLAVERFALRHGMTFDDAARALAETGFNWMTR
jgi:hypothetical protein